MTVVVTGHTKRKFNLFTNSIFILVAVFALVKPDSLAYIGLKFLDYALIGFDCLLMFLLMLNITNFYISKQTILIILMYVFMIIPTILNYTNYMPLIVVIGPTIAACLFADYCMQKVPQKFIKIFVFTWEVLFTINLLSIIMNPGGMYTSEHFSADCYFLGFDNGFIYILLPYIGFSLLYSQLNKGKLWIVHSVIAIVLALVTEILVWSATGIVLIFLMLIYLIGASIPVIKKMFRPRILIGGFYLGTILIVFFRVIDIFAPLIVDVLHKSLTLSGRTFIWDYAIVAIKQSCFLGVGYGGLTLLHTYTNAHCLILDMLYKGGVFMLGTFVCLIHRFTNQTTEWIHSPIAKIIMIVVACALFGEITNSAQHKPFFWVFIVMASYIPQLSGQNNNPKDFIRLKM